MKLIIDIPDKTIAHIRADYGHNYRGLCDEDRDIIVKEIYNSVPLEDIVDGIKSHKWGHNEGSKEIYNNAIDDVLTYIEEQLGE